MELSKRSAAFAIFCVLPLFALISCNSGDNGQAVRKYYEKIDRWHQKRIQSLSQQDSWLTLAGLYSLEEGIQTVGADSSNDLVFPPGAARQLGTIHKQDTTFSLQVNKGVTVRHEGRPVTTMTLESDNSGHPTILKHDSFSWYIIERRGTYYLRLKDQNHPNLKAFNGIERFPVSRDWRIKAVFRPFDKPQNITIPDIMGNSYEQRIHGSLEFTVRGKQYRMLPLGRPGDEEFFIIFGDETNGSSTYSGGRYMYISTPNEEGVTYIDFNKAYNPPCVFTDYATCPLPPPQNRLDIKVTAGEKMYYR